MRQNVPCGLLSSSPTPLRPRKRLYAIYIQRTEASCAQLRTRTFYSWMCMGTTLPYDLFYPFLSSFSFSSSPSSSFIIFFIFLYFYFVLIFLYLFYMRQCTRTSRYLTIFFSLRPFLLFLVLLLHILRHRHYLLPFLHLCLLLPRAIHFFLLCFTVTKR